MYSWCSCRFWGQRHKPRRASPEAGSRCRSSKAWWRMSRRSSTCTPSTAGTAPASVFGHHRELLPRPLLETQSNWSLAQTQEHHETLQSWLLLMVLYMARINTYIYIYIRDWSWELGSEFYLPAEAVVVLMINSAMKMTKATMDFVVLRIEKS